MESQYTFPYLEMEICSNYQNKALISHVSKIRLYVIQVPLKPYLLPEMFNEQAEFMLGKRTRYQLISIRQIIEKLYVYYVPAIFRFFYYTKAFDTVN